MTDVYKVGVSLVMTGNFAQVLGTLSQQLLGVNAKVKELEGGFGRLKLAITGALGVFAGVKVLETMGTMVKYGDQLVHQQNLLALAGAKQKEVQEATAKAYEVSARVQTANVAEVLKHITELRYAFGDLNKASQVTEMTEKANSVMQGVASQYGRTIPNDENVWSVVKSLEMTNKTVDPTEYGSYLDTMTKLYTASGGKITPQQIFQAFKYGRTAAQDWDQQFIGGALGRAIQNLGGGSGGGGGRAGPGNALMSAYAAIVGDQMTKKAAGQFKGLGMYQGHKIAGADLFQKNPYEWVQQVLVPSLKAKGITSPDAVRAEIERLFPNRTASQIISEFATQGRVMMGEENSMYEKDIRLQGAAMGWDQGFGMMMSSDYRTNMTAFQEQWKSLMQTLGAAMVPVAIKVLKAFTEAFTEFTKFASLHPEAIREIGIAIGALAAALAVISAGALIAAIGPLIGAGGLIAGVATALSVLAATHWSEIKSGLATVADALSGLWGSLKNMAPGLYGPFGSPTNYQGGGGGAYYQPASYTTYGGGSGGGAGYNYSYGGGGGVSTGSGATGPAGVSTGAGGGFGGSTPTGAGLPHFSLGNIHSSVFGRGGGGIASPMNAGALPMGNLPIGGGVDRSRFMAELNQKPWLVHKMAAMVAGETGGSNDYYSKTVLAEAFNRAQARGISLEQALLSVSENRKLGYYAGLGAPGGGTYGPRAQAWAKAHLDQFKSNVLGPVLGGWDEASKRAGFEITGNASGSVAAHQIAKGTPHIKIGAETYFAEGPFKYPIPHLKDRPPDMYGMGPRNPAYSAWQWHHNFSSSHSAVPDHSDGHVIHVHNTTHLDGRVIAKNSMKHMSKMGQGRMSGARLADHQATRPAEV